MTPQTARLLSQALGTTPEFGVDLQSSRDLVLIRPTRRSVVRRVG